MNEPCETSPNQLAQRTKRVHVISACIPTNVKEQLQAAADVSNRTFSAEVAARLEASLIANAVDHLETYFGPSIATALFCLGCALQEIDREKKPKIEGLESLLHEIRDCIPDLAQAVSTSAGNPDKLFGIAVALAYAILTLRRD